MLQDQLLHPDAKDADCMEPFSLQGSRCCIGRCCLYRADLTVVEMTGTIRAGTKLLCHLPPDGAHSRIVNSIAEHCGKTKRELGVPAPPMLQMLQVPSGIGVPALQYMACSPYMQV